jgi:hypothetical protein
MKEFFKYIFLLKFLLSKETLILEKINNLCYQFNLLLNKYNQDEEIKLELSILENKFLKLYVQTKEHKSKIELFLYLITILK